MCVVRELANIEDMTGNAILDTFFIGLASLFFVGAGLFLPLWEYLEGRAPRRRRERKVSPAARLSGITMTAPFAHR